MCGQLWVCIPEAITSYDFNRNWLSGVSGVHVLVFGVHPQGPCFGIPAFFGNPQKRNVT